MSPDAGDALRLAPCLCGLDSALKLFVSEPVQEDAHHCLRAWQPHQSQAEETFCCLRCYRSMVVDFRNAGLGLTAGRAACAEEEELQARMKSSH